MEAVVVEAVKAALEVAEAALEVVQKPVLVHV